MSKRRIANFSRFPGGMALDYQPGQSNAEPRERYSPAHAGLLENVVIRPDGRLKTRCGFKWSNSPSMRVAKIVPFTSSLTTHLFGIGYDTDFYLAVFNHSTDTWSKVSSSPVATDDVVAYEDSIFVTSKTAGLNEYVTGTASWTAHAAAPKFERMVVHNDRLWGVDPANPLTIQGSAAGTPTDFTNGFSFTCPGDTYRVTALFSLEDDLYVFTTAGVWILTGYSENDFFLTRIADASQEPYQWSGVAVDLAGRGKCLLYATKSGSIRGCNRSGVFEVCSSFDGQLNKLTETLELTAAFLPDHGLYVVGEGSALVAVHCRQPYQGIGGLQWPVSKFTLPDFSSFKLLAIGHAEHKAQKYTHIIGLGTFTGGSATVHHFRLAQVMESDATFYPCDSIKDGATNKYYEILGKVRTLPFNADSMEHKDWAKLTVRTNVPPTHMTTFKVMQYMDRTLTYPVNGTSGITATAGVNMAFDLYGSSEDTQVELQLFQSDAAKTAYAAHFVEVHEMLMEFSA